MLVDTDVLSWNLRGNPAAAKCLDDVPVFWLSAVTSIELVQGMRDMPELRQLRQALILLAIKYPPSGRVDILVCYAFGRKLCAKP